jgi:hypothetical protein
VHKICIEILYSLCQPIQYPLGLGSIIDSEPIGLDHQGYCHLGLAKMANASFGAMCRYINVIRLRCRNIWFESI